MKCIFGQDQDPSRMAQTQTLDLNNADLFKLLQSK